MNTACEEYGRQQDALINAEHAATRYLAELGVADWVAQAILSANDLSDSRIVAYLQEAEKLAGKTKTRAA